MIAQIGMFHRIISTLSKNITLWKLPDVYILMDLAKMNHFWKVENFAVFVQNKPVLKGLTETIGDLDAEDRQSSYRSVRWVSSELTGWRWTSKTVSRIRLIRGMLGLFVWSRRMDMNAAAGPSMMYWLLIRQAMNATSFWCPYSSVVLPARRRIQLVEWRLVSLTD